MIRNKKYPGVFGLLVFLCPKTLSDKRGLMITAGTGVQETPESEVCLLGLISDMGLEILPLLQKICFSMMGKLTN